MTDMARTTSAAGSVPLRRRVVTGLLAGVFALGALAVVLAAMPSPVFDLDRFLVPKELAVHVTALLALVLTWLLKEPIELSVPEIALLCLAAWTVLSGLFATNPWLAFRTTALTTSGAALIISARAAARAGLTSVVVAALGLAALAGTLSGVAQAYGWSTDVLANTRAPGGTFGNRNFMAHLTVIGLPLLFWLTLRAKRNLAAWLWSAGLALAAMGVVLSRSRAAWIGLVASLGVGAVALLIAARGRRDVIFVGRRLRRALGLAALGAALALVIPNTLRWRSDSPYRDTLRDVLNYRGGSGRGRLIQYRNSFELVKRNPVFGTGPGNWPVLYPQVTTPGDPSFSGGDVMPTNPWPSSDWVALVAERGPIALLIVIALGAGLGLVFVRRLGVPEASIAVGAAAGLAVLTAAAVEGLFDAVLLLPQGVLFVAVAAGALLPPLGTARTLSGRARGRALLVAVLWTAIAATRSGFQVAAIATAGAGDSVEALERAAVLDPGSYRLHIMIANRTECRRSRPHAWRAFRLFPFLPAPRQAVARCPR
ncbi:MAG: O-antigen ligase family protein [Gemmatimonadota bacterium]